MEDSVPPGSICCFCTTAYNDEALYGKFYKIQDITTHYFCLLLSSKIQQRGSDEEGILGFLVNDIRDEIKRGKNMTCTFCLKRGATISCHRAKCKIHFHLPCGRLKDTFHQFFGEFKSFCCKHRLRQKINQEVLKAMSGKQSTCYICLESVPATPSPSTLWAPCCSKDAWFHRLCIQRLALSAGYFFKCPLCNNTGKFVEAMRTYGIWIPEQDASWERDPERYEGLLQRHNSCDAVRCLCRRGRTYHLEDTKWEIKLCADCGSQGTHMHCGNLNGAQDWVCPVCASILSTKKNSARSTGKISLSRQTIQARNRARRSLPVRPSRVTRQSAHLYRTPEEEEHPADANVDADADADVDVETIEISSEHLKETNAQHSLPGTTAHKEIKRHCLSPSSENSEVEILEMVDNSDDEIQMVALQLNDDVRPVSISNWICGWLLRLYTVPYVLLVLFWYQWLYEEMMEEQLYKNFSEINLQRAKKNEPLACSCKRNQHSCWPYDDTYHFRDDVSSCCYDRSRKCIPRGKTPIKGSNNDLLSRFFSALAMCPGAALGKGGPRCHHLWVIQSCHPLGCPLDSTFRRSRPKSAPRQSSCCEFLPRGSASRTEPEHSTPRRTKEERNSPPSTSVNQPLSHALARHGAEKSSHRALEPFSCTSGASSITVNKPDDTKQCSQQPKRRGKRRRTKSRGRHFKRSRCSHVSQKGTTDVTSKFSQHDISLDRTVKSEGRRGLSHSTTHLDQSELSTPKLAQNRTFKASSALSIEKDMPERYSYKTRRNKHKLLKQTIQDSVPSCSRSVNCSLSSDKLMTGQQCAIQRKKTSRKNFSLESSLTLKDASITEASLANWHKTAGEKERFASGESYKNLYRRQRSQTPCQDSPTGQSRSHLRFSGPRTRSQSRSYTGKSQSPIRSWNGSVDRKGLKKSLAPTVHSHERANSPHRTRTSSRKRANSSARSCCGDDVQHTKQTFKPLGEKRKRCVSSENKPKNKQGRERAAMKQRMFESCEKLPKRKPGRPRKSDQSNSVMGYSHVKHRSLSASQRDNKTACTKDRHPLLCSESSCLNVGKGDELAKLPHFQPKVLLGSRVPHRNEVHGRRPNENIVSRDIRRRERSASVERTSSRIKRREGGRSRREQFVQRNVGKRAKSTSPVNNISCVKPPRKRNGCRTFKNTLKRSPVRTRSRSRISILQEFSGEPLLQPIDIDVSRSLTDISLDLSPEDVFSCVHEESTMSPASSTHSFKISSSDETDDEYTVDANDIKDTIAKISLFQPFVNRDLQSILFQDESPESHNSESSSESSSHARSCNDRTCTQTDGNNQTLLPDICAHLLDSCRGSSESDVTLHHSHIAHQSSYETTSVSLSMSYDLSAPNHSPILHRSLSLPSTPHLLLPSFQSTPSSLFPPCCPLPPPDSHPSPVISHPSSHLALCTSFVPYMPTSESQVLNNSPQSPSLPLVSSPFQSPATPDRSSTPPPSTSAPSPRRSLRSPRSSAILSYYPRPVRKAISEAGSPLSARCLSPPPIFPSRSGSPTEMECRIKARALTARKFVPLSHIATEQRAMIRQLQVLQGKM